MVSDFLRHGQASAISTAELVKLTGATSARDLQMKIAAEREQGHLILSSCRKGGGYFLPAEGAEGREEISRFVATLQARAIHTLRALRDAKRALEVLDGQENLLGQQEWGNEQEETAVPKEAV